MSDEVVVSSKGSREFRKRETAARVFAFEINATQHEEGEVPKYAITPLGRRVSRIYFVGALLDKQEVNPESNVWKLRIAGPTGSIRVYVSRFQPQALEKVIELEPPTLVAVVGKLRIVEVNDRKIPVIRPEAINEVDKEVRDYWIYETLKETRKQIAEFDKVKETVAGIYSEIDVNSFVEKLKEVQEILKEEYIVEEAKTTIEEEVIDMTATKNINEEEEEETEDVFKQIEEFENPVDKLLEDYH